MKKTLNLCVAVIAIALCSCQKLPPEYNLGFTNETDEIFTEAKMVLIPKGLHSAGWLSKTTGSWYMMINYWPVPEEVKVTFLDSGNKSHELKVKTGLPKHFRGEILVTIKKDKDKRHYLELKTGKLGTLTSAGIPDHLDL